MNDKKSLPDNFARLHGGEEIVRSKSLEFALQSDDLSLHLQAAEASANYIHHIIHRDEHRDEDDLTVRLLGIRMFNGLNGALKLLLSGYYQNSTLLQRDIIETFFLLDYFSSEPGAIARWRTSDDKALRSSFTPVVVRKALDARDGFQEKKREASYKLFSNLAGHPHPKGFAMFRLPNGKHHCGPFFEPVPFRATLAELGRNAIQAGGILGKFFDPMSKLDHVAVISFLRVHHRWMTTFYGEEPSSAQELEELAALLEGLPD